MTHLISPIHEGSGKSPNPPNSNYPLLPSRCKDRVGEHVPEPHHHQRKDNWSARWRIWFGFPLFMLTEANLPTPNLQLPPSYPVTLKTGRGSTCLNHIIIREKATEVQDDAFDFPYSCQLRQNLIVFLRAKGLNPRSFVTDCQPIPSLMVLMTKAQRIGAV